jgi:hypothetical protein
MTAMDRKPTRLKDFPDVDTSGWGRTAWDPVSRRDGTRERLPTPRYQRAILGFYKWLCRADRR